MELDLSVCVMINVDIFMCGVCLVDYFFWGSVCGERWLFMLNEILFIDFKYVFGE